MTNSRCTNYPLMELLVAAVINAKLSGFRKSSHYQRAHLHLVSGVCQPPPGWKPIGCVSPPSLQELSESEAWVGISEWLRLHLLACAYARSFLVAARLCVCLQLAERLESCPDQLLRRLEVQHLRSLRSFTHSPTNTHRSSGRGITHVCFPII